MTTQHDLTGTGADTEWRSYDEFAAGIDTYRLPNADLTGTRLTLKLDDGSVLRLAFDAREVVWSADGALADPDSTDRDHRDPIDVVRVRDDVVFVNLPLVSRERESLTVVYSESTHRALVVRSRIARHDRAGEPRVGQTFWSAVTDGGEPTGEAPGPSRDLIGVRNLYRYSPEHLYEHVYISSERYAWQCITGVQRGHGDMDLSTVWRFADDLYLFCFREFRIAVASAWLHDLGPAKRTTGVFLGITGSGEAEHSRAGGHVIPLGTVDYPDAQPV
ncbi:MoaF C-terminal domain-containing protein [Leucobacter musarum]|uniref:MoaF C-terminal domain-containing protein n=1 Tax=Leucobacter musarum TaxID=1930747 RepID=UPI0006A79592|nr:MoaF C-terminal domain-containing protein [Leucobacter musarum]